MSANTGGTPDPATDTVTAAVGLLRLLAGRVPDDDLQVFRDYLAAHELDMLATSLSGFLRDRRVALTGQERALLDRVAGPGLADTLPGLDTDPPAYRFTADGPEPGRGEHWLVTMVPRIPAARRVAAAYRRPADTSAIQLPTWVYLVEFAPGVDVARMQGQLRAGGSGGGVVEVYTEGETLPPYHVEALRAARAVWSRDT